MDLLKSGQKLSIIFEKNESMVEMACTIESVLEDRIVIELPPYFMRYIEFLQEGCGLTIKVFSKLGTIDFNTVVITSPMEEEFSVELDYNAMKLTPGEELPVLKALELVTMSKGEESWTVKTFEISTQYLKFFSERSFQLDEVYECELNLPESYGIISFTGIITDVDPVYENEFTITFRTMTEVDRQTLLYYMYMNN